MSSEPEHPDRAGVSEAAEPFADAIDDYVARNRDALAAAIIEARASLERGECDDRTIDQVIAEGRRRLKSLS